MILTEIQALLGVTLLTFLLVGFQGVVGAITHGFGYGLGARDEQKEQTVLQGRFSRTIANHIQGLSVFVPLVVASFALEPNSALVAQGATLFFVARLLFAICYLLGLPVVRTLIWAASIAGLIMMAIPLVQTAFG